MVKEVFSIRSDRFEANALFVQLSKECKYQCKNCYVLNHVGNPSGVLPFEVLEDLITNKERYFFNQLTLSVNSVKNNKAEQNIIEQLYGRLSGIKKTDLAPEVLHLTAKNLTEVDKMKSLLYTKTTDGRTLFDVVSISSFTEDADTAARKIKRLTDHGVMVNWNYLLPRNMDHTRMWKEVARIKKLIKRVRSMYLILEKLPMEQQTEEVLEAQKHKVFMFKLMLNTLQYELSSENFKKIMVDGCFEVARKTMGVDKKNWKGCASNATSFTVWPDGSVSGCPYAKVSNTGQGKTPDEVFENLKKAHDPKTYDFRSKCYLPHIMSQSDHLHNLRAHVLNDRNVNEKVIYNGKLYNEMMWTSAGSRIFSVLRQDKTYKIVQTSKVEKLLDEETEILGDLLE